MLIGCALLAPAATSRAGPPEIDWARSPILPPDLNATIFSPPPPVAPADRPGRVRLLGFQPGFLSDPIGLDLEDRTSSEPKAPDPEGDWITISHGNDNPYFDYRQRGDPGGPGYYRVNTQVQLFDSKTTAVAVGLQALTPAGLQYDGLPDYLGSTVVTPAVSLFHALEDGTALQGFVGKNVLVNTGPLATSSVQQNLRYGMAVQRPIPDTGIDAFKNFYLAVGALGQYRLDHTDTGRPIPALEVLPAFHWKLADNWWVSGTYILPVGAVNTRNDTGQWRLTCSFQF